jgi:juvenile hormone epoxide hydrolase
MMELGKIFFGIVFLVVAFCYQQYRKISKNLPRPDFDLNEYWGKGDVKNYKEKSEILPFKISYSAEVKFYLFKNKIIF